MKIDMKVKLKTLKGDDILDEKNNPVTIGDIISQALLASFPDDNEKGEEKYKKFKLAVKVNSSDLPIDITLEEAVKIKEIVGKGFSPLIVGQVWEILEKTKK